MVNKLPTAQKENAAVEVSKDTSSTNPSRKGRPRLNVDVSLILRLRDVEDLGWELVATRYTVIKHQFISGETAERRYDEAKAKQAKSAVRFVPMPSSIGNNRVISVKRATPIPDTPKVGYFRYTMVKKAPDPIKPPLTPDCLPGTK